ncbi:MAG TPA: hypothetical protein ENN19_03160 [Chloroflexi bacterium]|nr:hypothetical protein [Chloroflexota bacterium]
MTLRLQVLVRQAARLEIDRQRAGNQADCNPTDWACDRRWTVERAKIDGGYGDRPGAVRHRRRVTRQWPTLGSSPMFPPLFPHPALLTHAHRDPQPTG